MATFNFPNATTPDQALIGLSSALPGLPVMMMVFVWFFVFVSGSIAQNKRQGYSDIPQWAVFASLSTFLMALVMTINQGVILLNHLLITVAMTVLTGVWFFLSRGRFE